MGRWDQSRPSGGWRGRESGVNSVGSG
jgi:hypothetical protein